MNERTPRSIHETAAWAVDRIAARMDQEPVRLTKQGLNGFGFKAEDTEDPEKKDQRWAALFPDEHVVRIGAPNLDIRIKNASVRPAQDGMEVTANDGSLRALFLKDGHIAVEVFPIPSLAVSEPALRDETAPIEEISATPAIDVPGAFSGEIAVSEEPAALAETRAQLQALATNPQQGAESTAELDAPFLQAESTNAALVEQESKRVKNMRGNVANHPNMEPTPSGKPRVQFVLAEHPETDGNETTVYHRVYTLNKQAESLQRRGLVKGQKVGIDGYRQEQKFKKKDGTEIEREVIYANVVRTFGKREQAVTDEARNEPKE